MPSCETDFFAHKSKSWDMSSRRVQNAKSIADAILKNIKTDKTMKIMDLGAGTGLLSFFIAPHVGEIVAVDNSPSMLEVFAQKADEFACPTRICRADIEQDSFDERFDGVVSSMTMHHIADIPALFRTLYDLLEPRGFLALADLDEEDGTFHSDNAGVHHFGFSREALQDAAEAAGFEDVKFETASVIRKPHRDFSVFLMTARKS